MTEWKNGIAKLILPTPFAVGDVNAYLIKGERLTLVDCGPKTEECWNAVKMQLADLNLRPSDIEQVVLTHHHPDHAGALDYFPDSLEVYGHPLNERWINPAEKFLREQETFFRRLFLEFGLPKEYLPFLSMLKNTFTYSCRRSLTGNLTEGMHPPGLVQWRVIETPGHAQSQIALFCEEDGILIGGDVILAHISPNPILEPPVPGETERPKPQLQHNDSMIRLLSYPIQLVFTGHGEEVTDLDGLVKKRLARQHERAMAVLDWLREQPLTVFEICRKLFPSVYQRELVLTISETVAQLDYLSSIGEIMSNNNQPVYYKAMER